jgi:hypothetical protein
VTYRPLGCDVRDEDAVVLRRERHRSTGRHRDVAAVHPQVAGEDHVDQVAERPLLRLRAGLVDRLVRHREPPQQRRCPPPARCCPGRHLGQPHQQLVGCAGDVLVDLQ